MTPTPGRAAAVRLAYDLGQARQRRSWATPQAIGWHAWLEREAIRAADAGEPIPRPLRAAEEWLLWRRAAETEQGESGAAAWLAGALSGAARLLFDWSIPARVLESSASEECRRLARALEFVEMRSREAHAVPSHALCGLLTGLEPRDPVTFAGFAERSRARAAWIAAAVARSAEVRELSSTAGERSPEAAPGRRLAVRAADPADEFELVALWCRSQLAADPSRRLLVIVPDLAQRRVEAERVLEQALAPRQALTGVQDEGALAVESGEPLAGLPVVRHALTAFDLLTGTLEVGALSAWLRAAFWRSPDPDRARLDEWLRRVLSVEITPRELLSALEAAPVGLASAAATLGAALQGALRELGPPGEPAPVKSWAQRFRRSLEALGWPGARALSGLEQRAQVRFEEALADFIAIGGQVGAVGARDSLRLFEALLGEMPLQRASGEAAVTLTGALADPVVRYDGIWVAGLHADAWPPPPAVNPFIPLAAQRQAGIPGVTALGSLARARALLDVWSRSARELVTSWPGRLDDSDCLPSPLIAERPGVEAWIPGERPASLARSLRAARRSESFDDSGSPWPLTVPLPSGTRAVDRQARCPFRSYAELRLAALPLETPRPGFDPRERGRLMHRALEHLWRELGGSEGLGSRAAAGDLERLIEACVARAAAEDRAAAGEGGRTGEATRRRE
ncbi:MAG: PD-(D/E)XK nuclease family protein, partial [Steroidobacteraceae bacterium]